MGTELTPIERFERLVIAYFSLWHRIGLVLVVILFGFSLLFLFGVVPETLFMYGFGVGIFVITGGLAVGVVLFGVVVIAALVVGTRASRKSDC